jgi:hypothetical protein
VWAGAVALVLAGANPITLVRAQDPEPPPEKLFGFTRLSRPAENPPDDDASGFAVLLQRGDRQAIHVHVRRLDPGATYDVRATRGAETTSMGMITTKAEDAEPPPPRCFVARLDGEQEVPPVETRARGFAFLFLNRERTELHYFVSVRGLSGPVVAAHIHEAPPGMDGGVVIPLENDLRGTAAITPEQDASLVAGNLYVNIHTEANQDGEIRGQIEPCPFPTFHRGPRPGSGVLRLDTENGDMMPFNVASLAELEGATISVHAAGGELVLSGVVGELHRFGDRTRNRRDDDDDDDDGEMDDEQAEALALENAPDGEYFDVSESHDASFVRGDVNDDGNFALVDPIATLNYLFLGGPRARCLDAADASDDGRVDLSDAVLMLNRLFLGEAPPAAPHPDRGFDETPDGLYCDGAGN